MKPVDLKAMRARADRYAVATEDDGLPGDAYNSADDVPDLLALAELQTRALLEAEVGSHTVAVGYENGETGPVCGVCDDGFGSMPKRNECGHAEGCSLDASLTAAGFPDQASRAAERERLSKEVERAVTALENVVTALQPAQQAFLQAAREWVAAKDDGAANDAVMVAGGRMRRAGEAMVRAEVAAGFRGAAGK